MCQVIDQQHQADTDRDSQSGDSEFLIQMSTDKRWGCIIPSLLLRCTEYLSACLETITTIIIIVKWLTGSPLSFGSSSSCFWFPTWCCYCFRFCHFASCDCDTKKRANSNTSPRQRHIIGKSSPPPPRGRQYVVDTSRECLWAPSMQQQRNWLALSELNKLIAARE